LHNEELHYLHPSQNIIIIMKLRMRWAGHVACTNMKWNVYRVFVGKPEGKKPLGRPSCRQEDSVKMDLKELGWTGMNWNHLVQDRDQRRALVNTVSNLWVP
jgi:hypothetical protein